MKELNMKVPLPDQPELGMPYSWGTGKQWYVRLEDCTYWFTVNGLQPCRAAAVHRTNYQNFRYATNIRFTDCTDE